MRAVHICIEGYVQGVCFRATMLENALALGICGWVRNTADGSVKAHLEGEDSAVSQLIDWCRKGPEGARVDDVKITDAEEENCTSFEVQK